MPISTLITGPSDYKGLSNSTGLPTTSTGITSEERGDRRPLSAPLHKTQRWTSYLTRGSCIYVLRSCVFDSPGAASVLTHPVVGDG